MSPSGHGRRLGQGRPSVHSTSSTRNFVSPPAVKLRATCCHMRCSKDTHLVGDQQEWFRNGEPERLAGGFKLDIGNPVALAPAHAYLFILALEGCWRASEQPRLYVLECVDADDGVEAAVNSAGDHRHHATRGAHVKLGSLGAERVF
jgi:hypothetical protein